LSQFGGIFNSYSNTNDLSQMENDQISKLHNNRKIRGFSPQDGFHVFSWTLTQNVEDILGGWTSSIYDLAEEAYDPLFETGFASITPDSFPNVLYVDLLGSGISPDASLPFIMDDRAVAKRQGKIGRTPIQSDKRRRAKNFKRSAFIPGIDAPSTDLAALAMAVNVIAGKNPLV
jgi:hypothetical protein